jgi:hypothetical protein
MKYLVLLVDLYYAAATVFIVAAICCIALKAAMGY